jgi:uncharacterized protein (DUF1810 family)
VQLAPQESVYPRVLGELRAGAKQSHSMWFNFPQLRELGRSATAQRFGLAGLAEAKAYAAHDLLGMWLRECVGLANAVQGKRRSRCSGRRTISSTARASRFLHATEEQLFQDALDKFYAGEEDPLTLQALRR